MVDLATEARKLSRTGNQRGWSISLLESIVANHESVSAHRLHTAHPGSRAYRFFDASREVAFLHRMILQAVEDEIPRELAWLSGYDKAFERLDAEFDLPAKDLSALIRMAQSNQGRLSTRRQKQYVHLPVDVLDRIEEVVCESFGLTSEDSPDAG